MKVMLVDDEESIKIPVEAMIMDEGYDFCYASDGIDALRVFNDEKPDLVILDVMMAKMNGFEVCRRLRASGSNVPILMLTAKGDILDKSIGFRAGADDYLVKPFSPLELLLRIEAHLRRKERENNATGAAGPGDSYCAGDIEFSVKRQEIKISDRPVELTPTEFKLLEYLASHPGEVFSREHLQEYLWGENYSGDLTSIAVYVRKIREKIEEEPSMPKYLQTIWGIGYKFNIE